MLRRRLGELASRLRGTPTVEQLRARGAVIGEDVHIGPWTIFDYSYAHLIEIGSRVTIAPRVHLLAHDASTKRHLDYTRVGRIVVEDDVFLGAGSTIMPGVRVGAGSIVGVHALVTKDVPPGSLVIGVPAKVVMTVEEFIRRRREEMESTPVYGPEWAAGEALDAARQRRMRDELGDGFGYLY
jgi:maltose O-acetyltransferase